MSEAKAVTVVFQGSMTIQEIDAARLKMVEAISCHSVIDVDCSGVAQADITFVQMLLAARLGTADLGKVIRLTAPAAGPLRETLERSGLLSAHGDTPSAQFWAGK